MKKNEIKKTVNGLRVHYYQNTKTKITSFGYRFCFGSRAENRKEYGLFHMLEHNIFKGTETFNDPTEITRFFNERSYDINAMTNHSFTSYYAEGLTDFLFKDDLMRTFTSLIFQSTFNPEEFEKEKNPILNEYEMYANDTNETFFETSRQKLLGEEFHPILGTKTSIKNMTRDQVYRRYKELYNKENCVFIIETSKSWNKIEKEIMSFIDIIPSGEPYVDPGIKSIKKNECLKIKSEKIESGIISIYYPIEEAKSLKEKTMRSLVLATVEKMIYDQFRDREGIATYSQSCRLETLGQNQFVQITAFVDPKSTRHLAASIVNLLKKLDKINWTYAIQKIKMNVAKSMIDFIEDSVFGYVIGAEKENIINDKNERYKMILNADKKISKTEIAEFIKVFKKAPVIHYMA